MNWIRKSINWSLPNSWVGDLVCWWSYFYYDIHTEEDDIKKIPDHRGEYTCQRCGKIFKL